MRLTREDFHHKYIITDTLPCQYSYSNLIVPVFLLFSPSQPLLFSQAFSQRATNKE